MTTRANESQAKRAKHVSQNIYNPNKILIGKASDDQAEPEEARFDVFKVGITMLDYVMILVKISRNLQVSKEVANEVKVPYVESLYAGTNGIMPDAVIDPIVGPRAAGTDQLETWKERKLLLNKG